MGAVGSGALLNDNNIFKLHEEPKLLGLRESRPVGLDQTPGPEQSRLSLW